MPCRFTIDGQACRADTLMRFIAWDAILITLAFTQHAHATYKFTFFHYINTREHTSKYLIMIL